MPNLVALTQTIWASVGGPKNLGVAGPRPLGIDASDPTEARPSPTCVNLLNLVTQMVGAYLRRSSTKVWVFTSCLSKSLKVLGTDTDRLATYDFLL